MDTQQNSPEPGKRTKGPSKRTLIGVLIGMTILVIFASISVARYTNSVTKAKEETLKVNLHAMNEAIDQYYADRNRHPATLDALVEERYLRSVPEDPFTDSTDTWQTVTPESEPGRPSAEIGVVKVKSGSNRTAIDGSRYRDW
jgi:general secretion pathway protein G